MKIILEPRTDIAATVTLKNNKLPGKVSSQATSWMCNSYVISIPSSYAYYISLFKCQANALHINKTDFYFVL